MAQSNSSSRPRVVESPEVQEDAKVIFRLRAPEAKLVRLNGQWPEGRVDMVKAEDGVWEVTFPSIPSGVWEYQFQMDGVGMIDPANPWIKPMREPRTSILHINSQPPALFDYQDVPHGVVRSHDYFSKPLGRLRQFAVYTPPGYDQCPDRTYPILVLQHGSGDNQATWTVHGKAHWIADNLIAQGKAVPMVMVMLDGHAATRSSGGNNRGLNTELFEKDLLEEVLPRVEKEYRVGKTAGDRAIVGLSMGGGQSLTIGLNHSEIFSWVGGFSASVPAAEGIPSALENVDRTNRQLKLLWVACGKDDFLLNRNQAFIDLLKEKQIHHEWFLTEGNHSWPVWRVYLGDFLPRLFQ